MSEEFNNEQINDTATDIVNTTEEPATDSVESANQPNVILVNIDGVNVEKEAITSQVGFDGMTGQPVIETKVQTGFDGMTGQPVYSKVERNGFDGMTGQPVYSIVNEQQIMTGGNGPVAPATPSGKPKWMIPAIIAVAAVLVLVIALGVVKSGSFLGKKAKLALAIKNTVEEDTLGGVALEASNILNSDELTAEVDLGISSYLASGSVKGVVATDSNKGQAYAEATVDAMGFNEKAQLYYDDKSIQMHIPSIYPKVFEYNYAGKNKGYLADFVENATDGSIDDVNAILVGANKLYKGSSKYRSTFNKKLISVYNDIKIKKAPSEKFEVDGKERRCAGYTMFVTDDDIDAITEASRETFESVYGKDMEKIFDAIYNLTGEKMDMDDFFRLTEQEIGEFYDMEINFYVYKGKLAAITTELDGSELAIEFQGGDNRTSNIEVTVKMYGNKTKITRESKMSGKQEKGNIEIDGRTVCEYEYDTKTGEFEVNASGQSLEGVFQVKDGKSIAVDYNGSIEGVSIDVDCKISKGAHISEIKGKKFDIGNASEDDFEDVAEEIGDEIDKLEDLF